MSLPDSDFAHTAAPSAGQFKQAFDSCFRDGADSIVCVCLILAGVAGLKLGS